MKRTVYSGPVVWRTFAWWRRALQRAGHHTDVVPVVDVREVADGERGAYEVIKYVTKDINSDGEKLAPELYAELYKALDATRTTQASRGFVALGKRDACCASCGAHAFQVRISRKVRNA